MNDHIQDTFFDTKFGASKEELIANFKKHDLEELSFVNSDDLLHFISIQSKKFSFGGFSWENLTVAFTNGKFSAIQFYNAHKDKAQSISECNQIYDKINQKYNFLEDNLNDSTIFKQYVAIDHNQNSIVLTGCRYESMGNEIYYTAILSYRNDSLFNAVSDEL